MSKAVFLCVGTGGHVLPVINLIELMSNKGIDNTKFLVVTDKRGFEYFKNKDYQIITYPFVSSKTGIKGYFLKILKLLISIFYLHKILRKHKPDFLFTTGSYVSPVAAIVSKLLNVDLYIQEQNIYAGLGNKISAPFSKVVFTSFPNTLNIKINKIQFTGPVLNLNITDNTKFKMDKQLTVGFQGGSQGAKEVNEIAYKFIKDKKYKDINVIHIVGKKNKIINFDRDNYSAFSFIEDMQSYYNKINLQVSRSGGGILEAAYLNIKQFLVPYKYGTTSSHQRLNAEYLEGLNAAKIINNYEEFVHELDNEIENINNLNKKSFNIISGNEIISKILINELNK